MRYTVILEQEADGGFVAHIPALPGCVSQGDTRQEVLENIREAAGLYVQGYGENSHGLADTLLSLLPFRSRDIFDDMRRSPAPRSGKLLPTARLRDVEYPPARHLEIDPDPESELYIPPARIDELSEPFGNSVNQTRSAP